MADDDEGSQSSRFERLAQVIDESFDLSLDDGSSLEQDSSSLGSVFDNFMDQLAEGEIADFPLGEVDCGIGGATHHDYSLFACWIPGCKNLEAQFVDAYSENKGNRLFVTASTTMPYLLYTLKCKAEITKSDIYKQCLQIHKFESDSGGVTLTIHTNLSEEVRVAIEQMVKISSLTTASAKRYIFISLFVDFVVFEISSLFKELSGCELDKADLLLILTNQKTEEKVWECMKNVLLVFDDFARRKNILSDAVSNKNTKWYENNRLGVTEEEDQRFANIKDEIIDEVGEQYVMMSMPEDPKKKLLFMKWRCRYLFKRTSHGSGGQGGSTGSRRRNPEGRRTESRDGNPKRRRIEEIVTGKRSFAVASEVQEEGVPQSESASGRTDSGWQERECIDVDKVDEEFDETIDSIMTMFNYADPAEKKIIVTKLNSIVNLE